MENKFYIGNIVVNQKVIEKRVFEELKNFDSFEVMKLNINIDDNVINVSIYIEFIINLKTYKAIVDMVENKIFST